MSEKAKVPGAPAAAVDQSVVNAVVDQLVKSGALSQIIDAAIKQGVPALIGLIGGLFRGNGGASVSKVIPPKPLPGTGIVVPRLPGDDNILIPPSEVPPVSLKDVIGSVRMKIHMIQLSRELHPDSYTEENPQGLILGDLTEYGNGHSAIPRLSKVWLDLSAFDKAGRELGGDELKQHQLEYRAQHVIEDTAVQGQTSELMGKGLNRDRNHPEYGRPLPWTQHEEAGWGFGVTAWLNSLGMNAQTKCYRESTFKAWGSVGPVKSNELTIRVS